MTEPQSPASPAADSPAPRIFSQVTKVAGGIAAVTGAIVGLSEFFSQSGEVVIPCVYIAVISFLAYLAWSRKRRWLRVMLWGITGFLLLIGILALYLIHLLES